MTAEIIASVRWNCPECGSGGVLNLDVVPDVYGLMARVKRAHRGQSPKCDPKYCPQFVQIPTENADV